MYCNCKILDYKQRLSFLKDIDMSISSRCFLSFFLMLSIFLCQKYIKNRAKQFPNDWFLLHIKQVDEETLIKLCIWNWITLFYDFFFGFKIRFWNWVFTLWNMCSNILFINNENYLCVLGFQRFMGTFSFFQCEKY